MKLSKEFNYYGKRMRPYYRIPGLSVSEDGKTVLRQYEKDYGSSILPKRPPKKLTIQKVTNGYPYVNTWDYGSLMIDELVATCFCPPCPGSDYELVHKDGNSGNCHYQNLEWRKKQPVQQSTQHTTAKSIKLPNGLTVHRNGNVYDKKEKLTMSISHFDRDTGLEWSHTPKVYYFRLNRWNRMERKTCDMDALMAAAGYVAGERSDFTNPRILHKDNDWLNFKSDNLEWCDQSDPRYNDYIRKQTEAMNAWNKANNKDFPDDWLRPC